MSERLVASCNQLSWPGCAESPAGLDHVVHPWRVFSRPAQIQATHAEAICQT